ncbi:hypothetical protein E4413_11680 [Leptospira interrogans]|nr:hypothetical protein C5473_00310 [Leptospira interrogans serovar Weerasinghe]KAA1293279.1 hypothetical protein C4X99_02040 [Leptospira interrogans serovar Geyaweera]QCO36991.1 hypothetical protein E4412_07050 [Leptospira interrogans]QCO41500.1 hypothetical protein E4413_11680 [Leptospira interrogans]
MEFFKQTEDSCFLKNRNLVGILSFNFQFKFRQNGALLDLEKGGLDIKHLPQNKKINRKNIVKIKVYVGTDLPQRKI